MSPDALYSDPPNALYLEIDYLHHSEVIQAVPEQVYFLDREFVSNGADRSISRQPYAPCLRYRAGTWWIDNDSNTNEAVVRIWVKAEERKYELPQRCSFALPNGEVEVRVWDVREYPVILLTLSGTEPGWARPVPSGRGLYGADTEVTTPGKRPEADSNVRELFDQEPLIKVQLAAYCREYFVSSPEKPRPLSRADVGKCFGKAPHMIDGPLKRIQLAIWGELGHGEEVPGYLINRGLLKAEHQTNIPHWDCGHKSAMNK